MFRSMLCLKTKNFSKSEIFGSYFRSKRNTAAVQLSQEMRISKSGLFCEKREIIRFSGFFTNFLKSNILPKHDSAPFLSYMKNLYYCVQER